jgi:hypothetical protein
MAGLARRSALVTDRPPHSSPSTSTTWTTPSGPRRRRHRLSWFRRTCSRSHSPRQCEQQESSKRGAKKGATVTPARCCTANLEGIGDLQNVAAPALPAPVVHRAAGVRRDRIRFLRLLAGGQGDARFATVRQRDAIVVTIGRISVGGLDSGSYVVEVFTGPRLRYAGAVTIDERAPVTRLDIRLARATGK